MPRTLPARPLVPCGLLAGAALTGSAFLASPAPVRALPPAPAGARPVAQAVVLPSVLPSVLPPVVSAVPARASRSLARTPLQYVTRDVAVGSSFSGEASWYGGSFVGHRTASGEPFDTHDLTAASPTLPFGTRLRVCRRSQCVVVRVNDRGPYVAGRVLDLSQEARDELGGFGVTSVTATPVESQRVPVTASAGVASPAPTRTALPAPPPDAVITAAPPAPHGRPAAGRLAAGTTLMTGSGVTWLRRRRVRVRQVVRR